MENNNINKQKSINGNKKVCKDAHITDQVFLKINILIEYQMCVQVFKKGDVVAKYWKGFVFI